MKKIILSGAARQSIELNNDVGDPVNMEFYYLPTQSSWYVDLHYKNKSVVGRRLTVLTNNWHQWKNVLNFGLMVYSETGIDPMLQSDFEDGRCEVFFLDRSDLRLIEQ